MLKNLSPLKSLAKTELAGSAILDGNLSFDVLNSALTELNAKLKGSKIKAATLSNVNLVLNAVAKGDKELINYDVKMDSNLAKITKANGYYKYKNSELTSDIEAKIDDLKAFDSSLQGTVLANANAKITGSVINSLKANIRWKNKRKFRRKNP